MVDVFSEPWSEDQVRVMGALRDWSDAYTQLQQQLSGFTGLSTTDASALGLVVWAEQADDPLSPMRLGRRLGMSSGAVTALLDRLETAGLLARSKEHADRRRVTLRATEEAREVWRSFLVATSEETAGVLHAADPAALRTVIAFLGGMTTAVCEAAERLERQPARRREASENASRRPVPDASRADGVRG